MSVAIPWHKGGQIHKNEESRRGRKWKKNLIKLDGVEGLWYEQPDMLSKYKRRPDDIEEMNFQIKKTQMKSSIIS